MDIVTLSAWLFTGIFLLFSYRKDKDGTRKSLKMAISMGKGMALSIFTIIFAIGLLLALIPPEKISTFISGKSLFAATIGGALLGTVTLIPAFVAFPLVGSLIKGGVHIVPSIAFLTTLTMVGIVTIPLEKKEFGIKFTAIRNILSFIFAIIIASIMGVLI